MTRMRIFSPRPPDAKSPFGANAPKAPAEAAARKRRRLKGHVGQPVNPCCFFTGPVSFLSEDSRYLSFVLMLIQARNGCQGQEN